MYNTKTQDIGTLDFKDDNCIGSSEFSKHVSNHLTCIAKTGEDLVVLRYGQPQIRIALLDRNHVADPHHRMSLTEYTFSRCVSQWVRHINETGEELELGGVSYFDEALCLIEPKFAVSPLAAAGRMKMTFEGCECTSTGDFQVHLSEYLRRIAKTGEDLVVLCDGRPRARISPLVIDVEGCECISTRDFKDRLSEYLRRIDETGEDLVVLCYGRPKAKVSPLCPSVMDDKK